MPSLLDSLMAPDTPQAAELRPGTPAHDLYLQRRAAMERTAREQGLTEIPAWIDDLCKQQALQASGQPAASAPGEAPYAPPDAGLVNMGMGAMPTKSAAR